MSILGPPGIGKTSLAKSIANFLYDRWKFNDGIIYLSLRGCESAHQFLTRLLLLIKPTQMQEEQRKFGVEEIRSDGKKVENENDVEVKMKSFIINVLREKETLIIMDNTEDPLEADCDNFKQALGLILENC